VTRAPKIVLAIVLAFVAWFVAATLGNFVLRAALSNYRAEEAAMSFSLAAQIGRLALGVLSTFASSLVALLVVRRTPMLAFAAGCVLLVFFIPVHISLWAKFPLWYHLFFLASLPIGGLVFGRLIAASQHAA